MLEVTELVVIGTQCKLIKSYSFNTLGFITGRLCLCFQNVQILSEPVYGVTRLRRQT